ncbi:MAG: helix-turn-helix transcriptional regulator [Asticcacaulis sp.]|nr:helix-turn-helix transcriptional regulator [Asticcacaulis sp.]
MPGHGDLDQSPIAADEKAPHPFDLHVGSRVRQRRRDLGMSQDTLARAIDITFQQVQKYERGATRISASRLYDIALVLKVPVGALCQGFGEDTDADGFLGTSEGAELAAGFARIRSPRQRLRIVELVRVLADT